MSCGAARHCNARSSRRGTTFSSFSRGAASSIAPAPTGDRPHYDWWRQLTSATSPRTTVLQRQGRKVLA